MPSSTSLLNAVVNGGGRRGGGVEGHSYATRLTLRHYEIRRCLVAQNSDNSSTSQEKYSELPICCSNLDVSRKHFLLTYHPPL